MNFRKYLLIVLVFMGFTFGVSHELSAQPIDPCTDPADPCPIDDGVYFLLAAGIGAAAYKTYRYKQVNTPFIT